MTAHKQWLALLVAALGLIGLYAWLGPRNVAVTPSIRVDCPSMAQACEVQRPNLPPIRLQVVGGVPAQGQFTLQLSGAQQAASANWQMSGMEMGPNRYQLQAQSDGSYRASMALPMCTQQRHDWILQLNIDGQLIEVLTSVPGTGQGAAK